MSASANIPKISESAELLPAAAESKTFSVTLPADLAAKVQALAEREGRDVSDLLGAAFEECYGDFVFRSLKDVREYAATRNSHGYTEEDIPRLIKEVRSEQAAEEAARQAAKAS